MKKNTSVQTKKRRKKKKILLMIVPLVLIVLLVSYYQFFYKAKQVNSGIYKLETIFTAHTSKVWAVQFSPDGNLLASGSVDSTVKVWKRDGTIIQNLKHPAGVTNL
jgi:WD40 repeat protein